MNPYQWRVCVEFTNVLWLCDDCLSSYRQQRSTTKPDDSSAPKQDDCKNENNIQHTVGQLQSDIAKIKQCFAELEETINNSQRTNDYAAIPSTSTPQRISRRISLPNMNDTSRLLRGSNANITSAESRRFWIFFTRVAKHVSTDAISDMVRKSLMLNDHPEVMKLVPRWSNIENLRYVSFKVGVDWQYREKAIMESTWPAGLLFREFEHRDYLWQP